MIYRVEGASKILLYFLNDRVINLVSNKMIVYNRLCYNQVGSTSVSLGSMVELVDTRDFSQKIRLTLFGLLEIFVYNCV